MSDYTSQKYTEIKNKIRPFDLLAFRGNDFISESISFVQQLQLGVGEWTHVGMVVDTDILPGVKKMKANRLYVWESTMSGPLTDGVPSLETGGSRLGVQIRDLEEVINGYLKDDVTKIGWLKLNDNPIDTGNFGEIEAKMRKLYKEHGNAFYDGNCLSLFSALFPWLRCCYNTCRIGKSWMFCSELVAAVYKEFGLISVDPQHTVPQDFMGADEDGMKKDIVQKPILILKDTQEFEDVNLEKNQV